jgi:hypothetical protein
MPDGGGSRRSGGRFPGKGGGGARMEGGVPAVAPARECREVSGPRPWRANRGGAPDAATTRNAGRCPGCGGGAERRELPRWRRCGVTAAPARDGPQTKGR